MNRCSGYKPVYREGISQGVGIACFASQLGASCVRETLQSRTFSWKTRLRLSTSFTHRSSAGLDQLWASSVPLCGRPPVFAGRCKWLLGPLICSLMSICCFRRGCESKLFWIVTARAELPEQKCRNTGLLELGYISRDGHALLRWARSQIEEF